MAAKYSLQRVILPLAVMLGASTVPGIPAAPASGGLCLAAGLAAGGLPARLLVGIGVGWMSAGLRPEAIPADASLSGQPVVLRGDLGMSRGRDRWGNEAQTLRLRSVRRGSSVIAVGWPVEVRSSVAFLPGGSRIKGLLRLRSDGGWILNVKDERLVSREQENGPAQWWGRVRGGLRRYAHSRLQILVPNARRQGLLRSLVLGRADGLDPALQATFRRLGLGHLFAVSGLHVGIFAAVGWLVMCRTGPWRRRLAVVGLVLAYAVVLDPRGSVMRAAVVLVLWQVAELLGRRLDSLPALVTCLAILGLGKPAWFADPGLQLSALAVVGILTLGVPLAARLTPAWGWLAGLALIGLAAQATTTPLAAARFHWLAPLAPAYGVLAVPWAACVLTLSTLGVLLPISGLARSVIGPCLDLLLRAGCWLGELPPRSFDGFPVTALEGGAYATGLVLALASWAGTSQRTWLRSGLAIGGVAMMLSIVIPGRVPGSRMVLLDVGQGDSILIQSRGESMLVDGGSDGRRLLAQLARHSVRRLDALVVSHPDRDHCGGALEVARWMPVDTIWTPAGWDKDCYWRLLALPGVRLQPLWAGRDRAWNEIVLETLAPSPHGTRVDNDDSLVLKLTASERAVLLTGDIELRGERKLLRRTTCAGVAADILKVAHHGGRSSTRSELLRCVRPREALISSGAGNQFGHPSLEVLERLEAFGVAVRRSDREGSIAIGFDSG